MPKKFTHKEFLEKLWEKNEQYKDGGFKVISDYVNYNTSILVEDKYGVCRVWYTQLVNNQYKPSILSAVDKTSYFKNEVLEVNDYYKNKHFKIVGEYKGRLHKILTLDKYGLCKTNASSLLAGYMTGIESAVDREDYYYNMLKEKNPEIAKLVTIKEYKPPKVTVESSYGELCSYSDSVLEWESLSIQASLDKADFWIRRAKDTVIFSNNVDYKKCIYENNKSHVLLRCKLHNYDYTQRPSHHMNNTQGCPYCSTSTIKYSKENFEKHKEFFEGRKGILYVLNLKGGGENFYKVGITGRDEKYRLNSISQIYKVNVEYIEEMSIEEAYNLEQFFLNDFKKYKYTPKIKFKGYTECLTTNPIDEYYYWFNNR